MIDADLIENFIAFGIFGKQFNIRAGRNMEYIPAMTEINQSINREMLNDVGYCGVCRSVELFNN